MAIADNEVLQGLASFQQSVQQLQQQRAVTEANNAVNQIHQSELDEEQKLTAFRMLGQQFAFQAASSGMPMEQAKGLISQIVPPERFFQTAEQAILNAPAGSKAVGRAQGLISAEQQNKKDLEAMQQSGANYREGMKVDAAYGRAAQKRREGERKAVESSIGDFMRAPDVKPLVEARTDLSNIQAVDDGDLADTSTGFNLMKKGLARLAEGGGKITDKDFEIIQGDPDFISKVRRYISTSAAGRPMKADVAIVRAAAKVLGSSVEKRLQESALNYASSKQGLYESVPKDELLNRLNHRLGFGVTRPEASVIPLPQAGGQQQAPAAAPGGSGLRSFLE
jgi:hypothetical protein